jgi:predicted nucleic acid-binding protein
MSRVLVDTDILSEILKNRDANVARAASQYLARRGELIVSAISVMEVAYGLNRANRLKQLGEFESAIATQCLVLPFDEPAAFLAGRIEADLEKSGTPIDAPDVMIAATAICRLSRGLDPSLSGAFPPAGSTRVTSRSFAS